MNVTVHGRTRHYRTVAFDRRRNAVLLVDQRQLPHRFKIIATPDFRATARAIKDMTVRGAGAIGATAAYGLAQGARAFRGADPRKFGRHVEAVFETLKSARPTAVDPVNAMLAMIEAMRAGHTVAEQKTIAMDAAEKFADEDVQHCEAIGRHGAGLIRENARVLTHCNAGWLAFVDIGSATAPMYAAQQAGRKFHVYCDETRPRCQGATLTAWELSQQKISHQIIADNAAGHLMQRGKIDLVIVGSDRTLGRTGEVANKIGTYTKAVLARRHNIPFYVAIPLSTIDWNLRSGLDIPIEERDGSETLGAWGIVTRPSVKKTGGGEKLVYVRIANPDSTAHNPGFDVTPAELITGIITPHGIIAPGDLWKMRGRLGYRKGIGEGPGVQDRSGKTELALAKNTDRLWRKLAG
jgi:methylthioribose-1-phosphate isomerase